MLHSAKKQLKRLVLNGIHQFDQTRCKAAPSIAHGLPSKFWDVAESSAGHAAIQGWDVVELARSYGTPLYVVDGKGLEETYKRFYRTFAQKYAQVEIAYSYKTNPLPKVIHVLHEQGASAEVISEFELWLALRLGVSPERIIYNGPGKTKNGLERAISKNIRLINVDNLSEIDAIDSLASQYRVRQQVGVRIVTSVGWSSQFGLSIKSDAALEAFRRLKSKRNLSPCGLHIHLGTGIHDVRTYLQAIKEVLDFAELLRRQLQISIYYLDFGGGFGVPTVRSYAEIDFILMQNGLPPRMHKFRKQVTLEEYAEAITNLIQKYYPVDSHDRIPIVIFEPGRAITSSAQSLLLEVIAIKRGSGDIGIVILNGGRNITMPLGYEYHEILAASRINEPRTHYYNLYGPLCHPGDVLFKCKKLPELVPGDILAVMDAGAYFVPNQMNFSNPRPAAVMVRPGHEELIRKHESFQDIIAQDLM